ncbi:MAG: hypothetical protein ACI910_003142, partial [Oleispira sp.]
SDGFQLIDLCWYTKSLLGCLHKRLAMQSNTGV